MKKRGIGGLIGCLVAGMVVSGALLFLAPRTAVAQHGHPLVGTWSGFLERGEAQPLRALLDLSFSVDQVISGMLIANGQRFPITAAAMNHQDWSVTLTAQGQDRAGNTLTYEIEASIENLDSPTQRTLAGTWREGANSGNFQVVIN